MLFRKLCQKKKPPPLLGFTELCNGGPWQCVILVFISTTNFPLLSMDVFTSLRQFSVPGTVFGTISLPVSFGEKSSSSEKWGSKITNPTQPLQKSNTPALELLGLNKFWIPCLRGGSQPALPGSVENWVSWSSLAALSIAGWVQTLWKQQWKAPHSQSVWNGSHLPAVSLAVLFAPSQRHRSTEQFQQSSVYLCTPAACFPFSELPGWCLWACCNLWVAIKVNWVYWASPLSWSLLLGGDFPGYWSHPLLHMVFEKR